MKMDTTKLLNIFIFSIFLLSNTSHSLILSTNSRYIISPSGDRFKLMCVNWVGHLHVMIPEGLDQQPLNDIARRISTMGFNCVRLTWAIYMYTESNNANLTVKQSLDNWNLGEAKDGIRKNNPNLLNMRVIDVQRVVIDELGNNDLVVVLDNHVSLPKWCCSYHDGNGFFGDEYFDPEQWLNGLSIVAQRYKGNPTVVGMSMRNELRGPNQSKEKWYNYMHQGAEAIHQQNPDLLVIVSGLTYDTNLFFLKNNPFTVTFKDKLVFESHWYSFGNPLDKWKYQTNEFCGNETNSFNENSGFLITGDSYSNSFPLILSEFGVDQSGGNEMEGYYFNCLLALLAEKDIDWAFWALQGSYMLRENVTNMEEFYGMLSANWSSIRNSNLLKKLQFVQQVKLDPNSNEASYHIIYHPQSGLCLQVDEYNNIFADDCRNFGRWSYNGDGTQITLADRHSCLAFVGDEKPVTISNNCSENVMKWHSVSRSKLHLATKDERGNLFCLDWDYPNSSTIVTKKCLCLDDNNKDVPKCEDNPQRQWFSIIPSNVGM